MGVVSIDFLYFESVLAAVLPAQQDALPFLHSVLAFLSIAPVQL